MTDDERPRSEGNASDYDTDLECEEEEAGGGQSDEALGGNQRAGLAGRKRLYSEAAAAADDVMLTEQLSREAKCKQASNLHNEREKERRKDLKQAVHRLRNQLQLHQTKKATTISVLKASEQEIKDLLKMEESQKKQLTDLQTQHKHLTWKLENLMAEQKKGVTTRPLSISCSSPAAPVLASPLSIVPPSLTTMAPVFYMPSTPSGAVASPSIPASPHTPPLVMHPPRPISPSTIPFVSFGGFPHSALLSPTPAVFPPMVTAHPHHRFPIHPAAAAAAARQIFVMPSGSPPSFAVPHLLPTPGRFVFPSAPGTPPPPPPPPPHLPSPSSLLFHSLSPQGPLAPPHFPVFLPQPADSSTQDSSAEPSRREPNTLTLRTSPSPHDRHTYRENPSTSPETPEPSDSPQPPFQTSTDYFSADIQMEEQQELDSQTRRGGATGGVEDTGHRRFSNDGSEVIDVETPDQEEGGMDTHEREVQPFLGIRCPHRKQRKRHETKTKGSETPYLPNKTRESINCPMEPLQVLDIARKTKGSRNFTEDTSKNFTSGDTISLKNRGLFINRASEQEEEEVRFDLWKRRKQSSSPSVIDLAPRLPTVICS